jgi:TonB family protein
MNTLFIYMTKVAIYLIAFYLVYALLLSRDTSYGRNRVFILLSFVLALVLPLATFQTLKPMGIQFFGRFLSDVFVTASRNSSETVSSESLGTVSLQLIYSVYILGVIVFIIKFFADLLNLLFLIGRQKNNGSRIIRFHGFNTSGFSAMGYVFINTRLSPEEAGEIIRHEQNHLQRNHFMDVIFVEMIKAIQWFNPVVYLFNRSLRAIHEYQADQGCLKSGVPVSSYQCLLLNQVFKSKAFNLTNSFSNPSLIKKRMIMMTKKPTSSLASIKLLIVIPVTVVVFMAVSAYKVIPVSPVVQIDNTTVSQASPSVNTLIPSSMDEKRETLLPPPPPPPPPAPAKQSTELKETNKVTEEKSFDESESAPFVVVEEMPMFPGGDTELLKYIAENTNYPETAKVNNIQGRVIIRFCVTAEGGVSLISVLKGVDPDLDTEAIRVVKTLPAFRPGKQGGKPVPVWYMVPITFTLK